MSKLTKNDVPESQARNRASEEDDDWVSVIDLAAVLWKRRWIVIGTTAIVMAGALAFMIGSVLLPPDKSYLPDVYKPGATMVIQSGDQDTMSAALAASGLSGLTSLAGVSTTGNMNGQMAKVLATSNSLLDALNAKFGFTARYRIKKSIVADTRKAAKKHLSAVFDEKTNLFTVSFEDIDPNYAKDVVDETVNLLSARFATLSGSKTLEKKALLEKKLADVDASVRDLEAKVKVFQSKYGVMEVEALATEQITILARLRSELILKEIEISNYEKVSRVNDPVMTQLKNERDNFLAKIKEIETGVGTGSRVMPSQKELPTIAFEYAKLQRDLMVQTELFKILTQQYELAKLNAAGQEPVFQILEVAEVPDKKSGPSRGLICVIATLAGFCLAVILAFIVETIEKIKSNPDMAARFKAISSKKGEA